MSSPGPPSPSGNQSFQTTRWSVVRGAAKAKAQQRHDTGADQAIRQALEELCKVYWYPLYAFARRQGESPESAMDATQSFFVDLLEKSWINRADPTQGRFRSFLITVFRRFLNDERKRATAAKRGGSQKVFSLDAATAEQRYQREPADSATAVDAFERRWALALLDRAFTRLEDEQHRKSNHEQFQALQKYLSSTESPNYAATAEELGQTVGQVKVAVHRLRKRFRKLLEEEVAQTVESPAEIQSELNDLLVALCRK